MFKNDSLFHPDYLPQLEEIAICNNGFSVVFTTVFCFAFFCLTLLFTIHRRKAVLFAPAIFSQPVISQLLRDGKLTNERIYLNLLAFIIPTQALFFFTILQSFFPEIFNLLLPHQTYIIIGLILTLAHFLGLGIMHFIFNLLNWKEISSKYYLYKLFFLFCLCISHLLILPLVIFSNLNFAYFLYIPIFAFLFIALIIRILKLNSKKVNPFQFFIYFCTLEILPYLVLFKFLILLGK